VLRLDTSKARSHLGWRPRLSLDTALQWTAQWFKSQHNGESARMLTLADINRYEQL
jgi:CDP-glucose 4,6-dehydratase